MYDGFCPITVPLWGSWEGVETRYAIESQGTPETTRDMQRRRSLTTSELGSPCRRMYAMDVDSLIYGFPVKLHETMEWSASAKRLSLSREVDCAACGVAIPIAGK